MPRTDQRLTQLGGRAPGKGSKANRAEQAGAGAAREWGTNVAQASEQKQTSNKRPNDRSTDQRIDGTAKQNAQTLNVVSLSVLIIVDGGPVW